MAGHCDGEARESVVGESVSQNKVPVMTTIRAEGVVKTSQRTVGTSWLATLSNTSYDKLSEKLKVMVEQYLKIPFRSHKVPSSRSGRHIVLDLQRQTPLIDNRTQRPYIDNTVRSCRYTIWDFFPRQLVAQFSKLGNFYFLCVSILQIIPSISTTGRFTTLAPLLCFVGFSMLREALDDLRRSRLDEEESNRTTSVFRPPQAIPLAPGVGSETGGDWAETKWKNVKVGNILRIRRDQAVPADIALLAVDGTNGVAYIETMALDGETNHKSKQAPIVLARECGQGDRLWNFRAHFVVQSPNLDLHNFAGTVEVADEVLPLANNEIIYRGSILRNTGQVFGVVVYTGEECKIRMSARRNTRVKAPALQAAVNKVVTMIAILVLILSFINTAAYQVRKDKTGKDAFYLSRAGIGFFHLLASFFLMFNPMIPLALYISLEFVKLAQIGLMADDIEMYDKESDTPMQPRTSTINEELGQVSYVFSDKTGTLTDNVMRLRKISVAGTAWLHDPDEGKGPSTEEDFQSNNQEMAFTRREEEKRQKDFHDAKTEEMLRRIRDEPDTPFAQQVRFFLFSIALCHTCFPERDINGKVTIQGASPDELALVKGAQDLGYLILDRQPSSITIKTLPDGPTTSDLFCEKYEILDVVEFSSARRRMSIVVRMPDQRICVFCKGADTAMKRLLRLSKLAIEKSAEITQKESTRISTRAQQAFTRRESTAGTGISHFRPGRGSRLQSPRYDIKCWLKDLGHKGRPSITADYGTDYSLQSTQQCLTGKQVLTRSKDQPCSHDERDDVPFVNLPVSDSDVFEKCFQHINSFASQGFRTLLYAYRYIDEAEYLSWRESYQKAKTSLAANRQTLVEQAGVQLERDFELLGVTAVEDRLQKDVPEAIDKLLRAGIKVSILTGDKRETAISIARSCQLVKEYSTMAVLDHEMDDIHKCVADAIADIENGTVVHSVIVIDGHTLSTIEALPPVLDSFLSLILLTDSMICCQASPSQKAFLISSIRKKHPSAVTLAIGDGANDISMIQEAHVGIGISAGMEGLEAARVSDYSVARFRFLPKLLLVHGRWNYVRTCKYVLGTLWKEMLFYLTQAFYQRWNGYTGTSLYEPWSLTLFQALFTCLPVVFIGIWEKDLASRTLLAVPELYTQGQRNGGFNIKIYLWWMVMATSDAVIIFFTTLGLYGDSLLPDNHDDNGIYALGALTFTACVIVISIKMQVLELYNKTRTAVIAILFSLGSWFIWMLSISSAYSQDTEIYNVRGGLLERFGRSALWWLTLIATLFAVTLWELTVSTVRRALWPTEVDVFQEYEKDPERWRRFEEEGSVVG